MKEKKLKNNNSNKIKTLFLSNTQLVSDKEMNEIINNKNLILNLQKGLQDIKKNKYIIIK